MILQNGTVLVNEGQTILKSDKPVSVSFNSSEKSLSGWINSSSKVNLTISHKKRPQTVRVNGQAVKFDYDKKANTIAINVGTGSNKIESE
jgi:hypothetical protein